MMTQKRVTEISSKRRIHWRKIHYRIFLIGVIIISAFTVHATSLPMVTFPLKPSSDTGPYQDEEFLELANNTIYGLSNQTIPNGTTLRELQTTQQKLAKMIISPELYSTAKLIHAYLYYTAKAGNEYSAAMTFYSRPYSPVYKDESLTSEAREYQAAAQTIWKEIQNLYPGVTPYKLETSTRPFSVNEDPGFKWSFGSSSVTGGLW